MGVRLGVGLGVMLGVFVIVALGVNVAVGVRVLVGVNVERVEKISVKGVSLNRMPMMIPSPITEKKKFISLAPFRA